MTLEAFSTGLKKKKVKNPPNFLNIDCAFLESFLMLMVFSVSVLAHFLGSFVLQPQALFADWLKNVNYS